MNKTIRNAKMVVMYSEGMTYQEIGDKFGMSRQGAEQIIANEFSRQGERRRRATDLDKIVYPEVRKFFEDNPHIGYSSFVRCMLGHADNSEKRKIVDLFRGEKRFFTVEQIQKICEVIGKPFEEVFAREDGADNDG